MGSPLRRPRVARKVLLALALILLVSLAVILLVVLSMGAAATRIFGQALMCSALLAVVPVPCSVSSTGASVSRRGWSRSPSCGAPSSPPASALPLNTWIIGAVANWLESNQEIAAYLGPKAALLVGAPLAAPLVEETIKAIGVALLFWFLRAEFDNVRDGFVYGALVGVGFNALRVAAVRRAGVRRVRRDAPWGLQLGARYALFGLAGHAMFTGIFGAFLGAARQTRRRWLQVLMPLVGLALAILAHTLNNSLGLSSRPRRGRRASRCPKPGPPPPISFVEAWL